MTIFRLHGQLLLGIALLSLGYETPQGYAPEVEVRFLPTEPTPGGFVQLMIEPGPETKLGVVSARLAGQPVLFEQHSLGSWHALAGIPVSADDSIGLTLDLVGSDGTTSDTIVYLPVMSADFPIERLSVAPRFSARPDSALAARVRAEVRRARRVSAEALETRRLWSGPFSRPRTTRVTSRYGTGREFNGEIQSRHLGVDLAGATGETVLAPNRAVVALVDRFYYGGKVVYLNHGAGLVTAYMHLSEALVAAGDTVNRGTPIGRIGATGRVTGAHLHWIARYGRVTLDPLSLEALRLDLFRPQGRAEAF